MKMRITVLIVLLSLVFVVVLMYAEPRHPACRIYLFPGLALAIGMFRALGINFVGRGTSVWAVATVVNTLIYSVTTWLSFWMVRRFWPGRRTS
jgi:hypothetical protein